MKTRSMTIIADEEWYARRDGRKRFSAHCPIAANDKCPRYYLSQKHASAVGLATQNLPDATRERIEAMWESSDVFASDDQTVSVWLTPTGLLRGVGDFCPEVTGRMFGLYCSSLRNYPNETDRLIEHKRLEAGAVPKVDPRWDWMIYEPRHYTDCQEFSVYAGGNAVARVTSQSSKRRIAPKLRFAVLQRDGMRCVYPKNRS